MPRAAVALLACAPLAACSGGDAPASRAPVAVGVPVGAVRLWAGNPHGGPGVTLVRVRRAGMDRRDVCLRLGVAGTGRAEADEHCLVRDPADAVVWERAEKGLPGGAVTVVAGHAGAQVRKLVLEVAEESHQLPVARGGGFLAVLPHSYRGRVALVARRADGTVATQSTTLRRRPGAVEDGRVQRAWAVWP